MSKAEVRQWRQMDGKWKQVTIGEVRIDDLTFQYINGESEATVFPGIIYVCRPCMYTPVMWWRLLATDLRKCQ